MSTTVVSSENDSTKEGSVDYPDKYSENDIAELERRVWRKFDFRILPIAAMFYFLSFLDRSNIANARVAGMQKALKMSNHEYSIALTVTYVPYILAELPSNLVLKYVGPDKMLPTMVTFWGLVCAMQGLVKNYHGLLACRFFLGLLEGGLFPCLVLYLSGFYPRQRLQIRISTFFAAASLSGAFSGLLGAAIIKMNGVQGRSGWAWIFILEGSFTGLFGLISFLFTPRSPESTRFLTTRETAYVTDVLREDGVVNSDEDDKFSWAEVANAFTRPQVILMAIAGFFGGTSLYGLAYFEPSIVAGLGHHSPTKTQLMSVPPFAAAFVLSIISAVVADKYHARGYTLMFFSLMCVAGFSIFLASNSKHVKYGSLFLSLPGTYCVAPVLSTWNANNSAPYTRRATAIAITFIMTNSGGIFATWLFASLSPAPKYTKAAVTNIAFSVGAFVCAGANLLYLRKRNAQKAKIRATLERKDEAPGLGDQSAWFIYSL